MNSHGVFGVLVAWACIAAFGALIVIAPHYPRFVAGLFLLAFASLVTVLAYQVGRSDDSDS